MYIYCNQRKIAQKTGGQPTDIVGGCLPPPLAVASRRQHAKSPSRVLAVPAPQVQSCGVNRRTLAIEKLETPIALRHDAFRYT